jgi:hypothetical protein
MRYIFGFSLVLFSFAFFQKRFLVFTLRPISMLLKKSQQDSNSTPAEAKADGADPFGERAGSGGVKPQVRSVVTR